LFGFLICLEVRRKPESKRWQRGLFSVGQWNGFRKK
jgi:hypothetical protein